MIPQQTTSEQQEQRLIMPEYGRNVQRMVEHALTIEDKEERTQCVKAIMQTMGNLFPYLRNEESKHKMYDHLAMMSDFRLDIDSPYAKPERDCMKYVPERLPYNTSKAVNSRYYGRILEEMIEQAIQETDEQTKRNLILFIASRMRFNYYLWNKDVVDSNHIKADINRLSHGLLSCDFPEFNDLFERPVLQRRQSSNVHNGNWQQRRNKGIMKNR